jgi:hypothetical protein
MEEEPVVPPGPTADAPRAERVAGGAPAAGTAPTAGAALTAPASAPVPGPSAAPASATVPAPSAAPASATVPGPSAAPAAASPRFVDEDGEPFDVVAFFDPDYGPPEGKDAWLAQVASPVADEYLDGLRAPPGAREMIAAGFTHRDRESGARGWEAGGPLDTMEPRPGAGRIR